MLKWTREFKHLLELKSNALYKFKELERQVKLECPHAYEDKVLSAMKHTSDDSVCEICDFSARANG